MKRITAWLLAACLMAGLLAAPAGAAERDGIYQTTLMLANEVELAEMTHAGGSSLKPEHVLQQHVLTYEPDGEVWPMVIYGSTLYGRSTMSQIAKYLDEKELSLVAGVNGSFFDMTTGIPYGFVVTDGILRTSGNVPSVGFYENGSAVIGTPEVHVYLNGGAFTDAEIFYNKALTTANGIGLYSRDYDTKTKNTIPAYNLILTPAAGSKTALTLPGELELVVSQIAASTASCAIPEGGFVLSIAEKTTYASALSGLKALKAGDRLKISALCADEWKPVQYACGAGEFLVEDGKALDAFTLDSKDEQRARTAVGVKRNGEVIFYTADESSTSGGMDLSDLAQMMQALGCERAVNLDGGGSTMLGVQYPGYDKCATANTPTDGSQRACANFIFLVREKKSARKASQLFVYPYYVRALPGASVSFTAKAADRDYMAAELPGAVQWTSDRGLVADGVLQLDAQSSAPGVVVSATSGGLTADAWVAVLQEVTDITLQKANTTPKLKSLHVAGESETQLTASASYYGAAVLSSAKSFTWQTTGGIGAVSSDGKFTAAAVTKATEGTIEVSYGKTSVSIPVTVSPANPFSDTKGHWAEDYINDLYFAGTLTGSTGKDGKLLYRPDDSMTRQEFVVALMRYLKVDAGAYTSVALPFADAAKIDAWAMDAMKAAYSLGYLGGSKEQGKLYAHPLSTISRQEAMVILSRTLPANAEAATDFAKWFTDASLAADWAQDGLAKMLCAGIISGSNGKLDPTGTVTRAQVAKMLWALGNQ